MSFPHELFRGVAHPILCVTLETTHTTSKIYAQTISIEMKPFGESFGVMTNVIYIYTMLALSSIQYFASHLKRPIQHPEIYARTISIEMKPSGESFGMMTNGVYIYNQCRPILCVTLETTHTTSKIYAHTISIDETTRRIIGVKICNV